MQILCGMLSVPHNIVMDLNHVVTTATIISVVLLHNINSPKMFKNNSACGIHRVTIHGSI